jgi:RNA polymerase sigma-70 factor (ECF subfamily)
MNAPDMAIETPDLGASTGFETVFFAHYGRIERVIIRVVNDPARAEEIAAEVFWKFWRKRKNISEDPGGWLYRTAVRMALDDLRSQARRVRREREQAVRRETTPEEIHVLAEDRDRVRLVLASLNPREAELLLLRADDLSYNEIAQSLNLNPVSVGTLLNRAQQAFRKEYVKQYGPPRNER